MEEFNYLLTDEFIAFSQKIAGIHEQRKAKKQELKEFFEKIQVDLKGFDAAAKTAEEEFETWKKSKEAKSDA